MNNTELNDKQLQKVAPSIFAKEPWSGVSPRYGFIPTIDVVEALRKTGFAPVQAGQSKARIADKQDFTRHVVRFRSREDMKRIASMDPAKINSTRPEIVELVLFNSHDRSSAYSLEAGMFRFICSNGLVVSSGSFDRISVRHSRSMIAEAVEGSKRIIKAAPAIFKHIEGWRSLKLTDAQRRTYASAALINHYGVDDKHNMLAPITADQLLVPRRPEDSRMDLWTTFNVVQENMMRGGIVGRGASGRTVRTRPVASVNNDLSINHNLWSLAEVMAESLQ